MEILLAISSEFGNSREGSIFDRKNMEKYDSERFSIYILE